MLQKAYKLFLIFRQYFSLWKCYNLSFYSSESNKIGIFSWKKWTNEQSL